MGALHAAPYAVGTQLDESFGHMLNVIWLIPPIEIRDASVEVTFFTINKLVSYRFALAHVTLRDSLT